MIEQNKKTYPPSWVVMQNSIQECFKSMSIDEKRMLILASQLLEPSMLLKRCHNYYG